MQYDLTRPNTGRMIDYWLGGTHNFEIDRRLATQVLETMPLMQGVAIQARSLIQRVVPYLHARGIRTLFDFGAALPTCENTHLVAQALDPSFKIIYSDIDPVTVAYGTELLSGQPGVIYLQCNVADPLPVLTSPATLQLIGSERRVGILMLTLTHLLSDDEVQHAMRTLYDWATPDSYLMTSQSSEHWNSDPALLPTTSAYRGSGVKAFNRTPDEILRLCRPWQLTEEGIAYNSSWGLPNTHDTPSPIIGYSMMWRKP
jgi:hypothetical protein